MIENLQRLHHHAVSQMASLSDRTWNQARRDGLSILELGSGHGLLAVCWLAMLRAHNQEVLVEHIVITDTEEHLPLIERTLKANAHLTNDSTIQITVMHYNWGHCLKEPQNDNSQNRSCSDTLKERIRFGQFQFDLIFGSDIAYHPQLYQPLIQSLQTFCKNTTAVLIGCTMKDTTPDFFKQACDAGFRYERFSEHLLRPEFRGNFGIFLFFRRDG